MDERTKQVLVGIIVAVIFIASVALIIIGQKNIGLLAFYNHKYK